MTQRMSTVSLGLPLNHLGDVLLTLRNDPHIKEHHRKWQLAGGSVEFGEHPKDALVREFQEELGVTPKILFDHPIIECNTWDYQESSHHIVLISYIVDIGYQPIVLNHENLDYIWTSPQKALELDTLPNIEKIISQAAKLISKNDLTSITS